MNLYEMIFSCVGLICASTVFCFLIVYTKHEKEDDNEKIESSVRSDVPTWSSTEETNEEKK